MSKSRFSVLLILVCLATSITFAQSYFNKDKGSSSFALAQSNQPMTASQYNDAVNQMSEQNKSNLSQQFKQDIAKQPAPTYKPPTTTGQAQAGTSPSDTTSTATAPPLSPPAQAPANTSTYSTQPSESNTDSTTESQTFNAPAAATPSPTPPPPTVPANPSTDSNKSWGIKY